jgi:hypothetical protein
LAGCAFLRTRATIVEVASRIKACAIAIS